MFFWVAPLSYMSFALLFGKVVLTMDPTSQLGFPYYFFSFCLFQLCFLFDNVITFYAIIVPLFSSIFVVLLLLLFYYSLL
jgi:hypothetical protein